MTGLRIACCDCETAHSTRVGCGIDGLDGFCGTVTDSPCAGTFAITFTIPEYELSCSEGYGADATIPARVVTTTIGQDGSQNCLYVGSLNNVSCDIDFVACGGLTFNATTINTGLQLSSNVQYAPVSEVITYISSPCGTTPLDASPPQCYGICLRVTEAFFGDSFSAYTMHGMGYNRGDIADCSETVLCLNFIHGSANLSSHEPSTISTVTGLVIS